MYCSPARPPCPNRSRSGDSIYPSAATGCHRLRRGACVRIALITHQWPGARLGGIGVYTAACARGLARAGHKVHLFTLPLPPDIRREFPPGLFLHQVPIQSEAPATPMVVSGELMYRRAMARSFASSIRCLHGGKSGENSPKLHFDIVEAPEYESLGAGFLGESMGIPLVTQLHSGSAIAREAGNVSNDTEQMLREAMELETIVGSDGICAPSQAVIDDTRRAYAMPDLAADAQVMPLPIDLPETPFSLPGENAPVLYVGRLELLKGSHLLAVAAADFLLTQPTKCDLRIIGSGHDDRKPGSGKPVHRQGTRRIISHGSHSMA